MSKSFVKPLYVNATFERVEGLLNKAEQGNLKPLIHKVKGEMGDNWNYFLDNLLYLISDEGSMGVPERKVVQLVSSIDTYYKTVYALTKKVKMPNIPKLAEAVNQGIYKVQAFNGVRPATKKEIESGAIGLMLEPNWVFEDGQDFQKQLYVMDWTITGGVTSYKKAGLEINWQQTKATKESFYDLAVQASDILKRLYKSVRAKKEPIVEKIEKLTRLASTRSSKMYSDFAPDEISVEMTTKALLFEASKLLYRDPKGRFTELANIAFRATKEQGKKKFVPSPLEISKIREAYELLKSEGVTLDGKGKKAQANESLKLLCEEIRKYEAVNLIDKNEFGLRIVKTLEENKCVSASPKQKQILEEMLKRAQQRESKLLVEKKHDKGAKQQTQQVTKQESEETEGEPKEFDVNELLSSTADIFG